MSWVSSQSRHRASPAWLAFKRLASRAIGRDSALRQADLLLLTTVLALTLLGTVMIWSATQPMLVREGANPHGFLLKQLLNIALGLVLMLVVSSMDSRQLRLYAPILYGVSCLGLVAVLTPLGSIVNGAKSWISLGAGFQIEPSEFAKLAVIVISAMLLSDLRGGESRPGKRAVAKTLGIAAVPILLVAAEPDLGVMIVLVVLVAGLVALSGVRLRWLALMIGSAALVITAVARLHLLKAYQIGRLTSFLNPSADPRGTGYSAAQSKIAIGSGGLHGTGLFHSQMIAGNFVPEQHTDFIFAVIGNELGLRRIDARAGAARAAADLRAADRDQGGGPVRHADRVRRRDLVRRAGVREHRHDDGHHAGHRPAAAVRVLRRVSHVRRHDRDRLAPVGPQAAQRLRELSHAGPGLIG